MLLREKARYRYIRYLSASNYVYLLLNFNNTLIRPTDMTAAMPPPPRRRRFKNWRHDRHKESHGNAIISSRHKHHRSIHSNTLLHALIGALLRLASRPRQHIDAVDTTPPLHTQCRLTSRVREPRDDDTRTAAFLARPICA